MLDINDFPSYGRVPRAVIRVAEYILHAAKRAEIQRLSREERNTRRRMAYREKAIRIAQEEQPKTSLQSAGASLSH